MIRSRSFLLHYFFMVQQSKVGMTWMVKSIDCQMVWKVELFLVEREC